MDIACQIFAEKGFDGATLQDIADRFGVLKGSLFHYIQSKDDLLFEIIKASTPAPRTLSGPSPAPTTARSTGCAGSSLLTSAM